MSTKKKYDPTDTTSVPTTQDAGMGTPNIPKTKEDDAYEKGKNRHNKDKNNPANQGSPKKDSYGQMSGKEKKAYKKPHIRIAPQAIKMLK